MVWALFNWIPPVPPPNLSVILDEAGRHYIDDEYRDKGIAEGWLELTGYYRNTEDRFVWTYVQVTRR